MIDFDFLLSSYTKLVKIKGYKTGGGKMYITAVSELFSFLRERGYSSFQITTDDMAAYHNHLTTRTNMRRGGTLADNTINHHLFAIKILFDYLLESKLVDALPVLPKYHRNKQEPLPVLTVLEIKAMYEVCKSPLETGLLSIAYGCGLRRREIEGLLLTDIDLQKGYLIVQKGKGNKRREVPMSEKVIIDIRAYIQEERQLTQYHSLSLLLNTLGSTLSGFSMNNMIKDITRRTPLKEGKHVTLHTLRRSIATHLVENGAGVHFIKEFLGHSELDTTQLYTIRRKRNMKII